MNISIDERYQKLIKQMVDSGDYSSEAEVVQAALQLLEKRQRKLEALRHDIQEGLNSGPGRLLDEALVEDIKRRGRERLARRLNAD